LNTL